MRTHAVLRAVALGSAGFMLQAPLLASGSIAAGRGISPRAAYTQGKALTFEKLVCGSCPLQKADLNRERAQSLKDSLEARGEAKKPGTPDDEHIKVLCPAAGAAACEGRPDEQELVHHFLTRRYKL